MTDTSPQASEQSVAPEDSAGKDIVPLLLLGVTVYGLWAGWTLWARDWVLLSFNREVMIGLVARFLFWVLPCGIYLVSVWGARFSSPLGLGFPLGSVQVKRSLVLFGVTSLALFLATAARNGSSVLEEVARFARLAQPRLTAPILEELVFRGVFLSELLTWTHRNSQSAWGLRARYWGAQLGCAVFFVLLHWPAWWHHLGLSQAMERSLPIFAVAMVLGFVFAHTRSIWPCIGLHWLNNELSFITQ